MQIEEILKDKFFKYLVLNNSYIFCVISIFLSISLIRIIFFLRLRWKTYKLLMFEALGGVWNWKTKFSKSFLCSIVWLKVQKYQTKPLNRSVAWKVFIILTKLKERVKESLRLRHSVLSTLKPNIWWMLANFWSFLGLETFTKKNN